MTHGDQLPDKLLMMDAPHLAIQLLNVIIHAKINKVNLKLSGHLYPSSIPHMSTP